MIKMDVENWDVFRLILNVVSINFTLKIMNYKLLRYVFSFHFKS